MVCRHFFLAIALVLLPIGMASAWQAAPPPPPPIKPVQPVLIATPPSVLYRQTVQQQQVRDQLQKGQLQQQLHQDVSDRAKLPTAGNAAMQQQLEQADRAQRDRERANQQAVLDRYPVAPVLPRVVPQARPEPARSGN